MGADPRLPEQAAWRSNEDSADAPLGGGYCHACQTSPPCGGQLHQDTALLHSSLRQEAHTQHHADLAPWHLALL